MPAMLIGLMKIITAFATPVLSILDPNTNPLIHGTPARDGVGGGGKLGVLGPWSCTPPPGPPLFTFWGGWHLHLHTVSACETTSCETT